MTNECPKCRTVPRLTRFYGGRWVWVCHCPPAQTTAGNNTTPLTRP